MVLHRFQRLSTLNKVILTTLVSVLIVFTLQVILVGRVLLSGSRNTARSLYAIHVDHIADSIRSNMGFISNVLSITQQFL